MSRIPSVCTDPFTKTTTKTAFPTWLLIGLLKITFLVGAVGFAIEAKAESTTTCPAGTYDMLDWMTMDSDLRASYHMEGTSNPLYTIMESDKFLLGEGTVGLSLGHSTVRQQ
jgi:hypothetical protein